jgi:hypothetical protein
LEVAGRSVAEGQLKNAALIESARASLAGSAVALQRSGEQIAASVTSHEEAVKAGLDRLDRLSEGDNAIRGELAGLNDLVRTSVRDARSAWSSQSEQAVLAVRGQLHAAMEALLNRVAELQRGATAQIGTSLQEEARATRTVLTEFQRGIATALHSSSASSEDMLNRISQVGQGTEGVRRHLLELKDLVNTGLKTYPPRPHEPDAEPRMEG